MTKISGVRIVIHDLYTSQLEKMAAFYCGYLEFNRGLLTRSPHGSRLKLESEHLNLSLVERPEGKGDGPAIHLCFQFHTGYELLNLISVFKTAGFSLVRVEIRDDHEEFSLTIEDPDGNLIHMHQYGPEYWGRNLSG